MFKSEKTLLPIVEFYMNGECIGYLDKKTFKVKKDQIIGLILDFNNSCISIDFEGEDGVLLDIRKVSDRKYQLYVGIESCVISKKELKKLFML